jgi:hypothetical protein
LVCIHVIGFFCSFDDNLCGFTQQTNDKFDWTRHKGRTSSGGTGPSSSHNSAKGRQEKYIDNKQNESF